MQKVFPLSFFLFLSLSVCSQVPTDSTALITFNQQLDDNVVSGNIAFLQKGYASDFVFSHGSGRVDGKVSWLGSVAKGGFIKQRHDSATVEIHGDIAILRSRVVCRENTKSTIERYWLRYIRVYSRLTREWQLISHVTTAEFHLPD
jgi:ketosteroid isomerase-like protein